MAPPQTRLDAWWDRFLAKKPGKVTSVFPKSMYRTLLPEPFYTGGASPAKNAAESYAAAADECRRKVARIVRECNDTNTRFTDPEFDVKSNPADCLEGLVRARPSRPTLPERLSLIADTARSVGAVGLQLDADATLGAAVEALSYFERSERPALSYGTVHRVGWIFEDPRFTMDGFSSSDIRQGSLGDCWFLAGVATICNHEALMRKICVARDEDCGVYGFVFQRDGKWISTVVDDNLFLDEEDFDASEYDPNNKKMAKHRKSKQTGSEALTFAHCTDSNETWLPLLEKAYAKVHGDYSSLQGGNIGEAVEDLTGGVATVLATDSILRKQKLWSEMTGDSDLVFGLGIYGDDGLKNGVQTNHAYTVTKAQEATSKAGETVKLVKIRNPWGDRDPFGGGSWTGPWSDGSKQWTPEWLELLGYRFGVEEGVFWMSFDDMLATFQEVFRVRMFDEKWTVVQQWTSVDIAWLTGHNETKFVIEVKKSGTVVLVLSQLDERYFKGLEGQYKYLLQFVLVEENCSNGEYVARARPLGKDAVVRSVSCEVDLPAGRYEVIPKITAYRDDDKVTVEDIVKRWADWKPSKLRQIGLNYDIAHAIAGVQQKADAAGNVADGRPGDVARNQEEGEKSLVESIEASRAAKAEKDAPKTGSESYPTPEPAETAQAADSSAGEAHHEQAKPNGDEQPTADGMGEAEAQQEESGVHANLAPPELEHVDHGSVRGAPSSVAPSIVPSVAAGDGPRRDGDGDDEDVEPWNAVCVLGLRVYAQDPDVSITLGDVKSEEQAASLVLDTETATAVPSSS